jgi:6-phosphogluconolactonase (cycloisomerase 2 family)
MKNIQFLALLAFAFCMASCAKEDLKPTTGTSSDLDQFKLEAGTGLLNEDEVLQVLGLANEISDRNAQPMLYTMSNQASGNLVMAFQRNDDGSLTGQSTSYPTGGMGTDAYLANQGALAMSTNKKFLYAVNPGSNELSHFYINADGSLDLLGKLPSGGEKPVSVAVNNGLVYVLNAGGDGNITGFGYNQQGQLIKLSDSTKPLSGTDAAAAQLDFSTNGKVLVATEAATNTITTFAMLGNGRPGIRHTYTTAGTTPMGFDMGSFNNFYVSEAGGSLTGASTVSSYHVDNSGIVSLLDGPVATNGTGGSLVVLSGNKQRMYTANSGSNSINYLNASLTGHLSLGNNGNTTDAMTTPVDAAMDKDSKNMYVLTSGNDAIITNSVDANGQLTQKSMYSSNLPDAMSGMVVK